jgi:tetratricopeptide (TPR) repeat protein
VQAAADEGLGLFGVLAADSAEALALEDTYSEREKAEITANCYELVLTLADAVSQDLPGQTAEDSRDRVERALRLLDRAGKIEPPGQGYHMRRQGYLARLGDGPAAKAEQEQAAAIKPASASEYYLLADAWYQRGDLKQAVVNYENALRLQPNHFWAECYLAVAYLRLQCPGEARASLTARLGQRPGLPWLYLLRGIACGLLGEGSDADVAAAEADFQKALDLNPTDDARYAIYVNRAVLWTRQDRCEAAVADLERAIALKPNQYQADVDLAQAYQKQKKWQKAAEALGRAIQLKRDLAELYRDRAWLRLALGQADAALKDFAQAIQLEPSDAAALAADQTGRARILLDDKRYQDAVGACDASLQADPHYAEAHLLRGRALFELKQFEEALHAIDRYFEKGQPAAEAYRIRAAARARLGALPEAIADFTEAIGLQPDSALSAQRGFVYVLCESWKLALHDFDEALRRDRENGDAYNGRGYTRARLGQWAEAIADAEEALRRKPTNPEMVYGLACTYAQVAGRSKPAPGQTNAPDRARARGRALELLRRTLAALSPTERSAFWRERIATDTDLDPIRQDPRNRGAAAGGAGLAGDVAEALSQDRGGGDPWRPGCRTPRGLA